MYHCKNCREGGGAQTLSYHIINLKIKTLFYNSYKTIFYQNILQHASLKHIRDIHCNCLNTVNEYLMFICRHMPRQ